MSLSTGERVGPYEILDRLQDGEGEAWEVYRAREVGLVRQVELRMLPRRTEADSRRLAWLRLRVPLLSSLDHPNIAAIHALEETDAATALVTELVEGQTLEERLVRGPLPPDQALEIARQIARALGHAHDRGVVHGDLSPASVKLAGGAVKVLNLGLATGPQDTPPAIPPGTGPSGPGYLSPEQARGRRPDTRSDAWAFGALLYAMLTGRRPAASESGHAPDLDRLVGIPPGLFKLLRSCLVRPAWRRLRSMDEARLAIEQLQAELGMPTAAPIREPKPAEEAPVAAAAEPGEPKPAEGPRTASAAEPSETPIPETFRGTSTFRPGWPAHGGTSSTPILPFPRGTAEGALPAAAGEPGAPAPAAPRVEDAPAAVTGEPGPEPKPAEEGLQASGGEPDRTPIPESGPVEEAPPAEAGESGVAPAPELAPSEPEADREAVTGAAPETRPRRRAALPLVVGIGALALALAVLAWAPWRPAHRPGAVLRLRMDLGAEASLVADQGPAFALSPDGLLLAFAARTSPSSPSQLYLRPLDRLEALPLPATEGARDPFFSPDGRFVAFFAGSQLKKVAVAGGEPVALCAAVSGRGGAWAEDGTILFSAAQWEGVPVSRVSSLGGTPEPATQLHEADGETTHRWPQVLPGGKAVLFTARGRASGFDDASLVVQKLSGGGRSVVHKGGYHGRYVTSGHLVFVREGKLLAAPFDLGRLALTGPAVTVIEDLAADPASAGAQFAVSGNGTLAYLANGERPQPPAAGAGRRGASRAASEAREEARIDRLILVLGFSDELRRVAPPARRP